jgi:NADPH:quinone reductase-like Zn-dependent oxidoreductase
MIKTIAWVLYQGRLPRDGESPEVAELKQETFMIPDLKDQEVLVEPIYGCWEGNMSHGIARSPVDICLQRGEEKVVLGNSGVIRVLKLGSSVTDFNEGDLCLVFCNGEWDKHGYPTKIYAYDAPGTIGVLAKQTKLHEQQLIRLPAETSLTLRQWAAFSLRYITAWANWKVAYGSWRLQISENDYPEPFVWGWGGGTTFAEVTLARLFNCQVAMVTSNDARLRLLERMNVFPIDRRRFGALQLDEERYKSDSAYKETYKSAENIFLDIVREHTRGAGVSIFIDYIGLPVLRASLKALARPGIITTAGWKGGMNLSIIRAIECMNWNTHVHTHYARRADALAAVQFAEAHKWAPPDCDNVYSWDAIPQLAHDYAHGNISSYFPIYQINSP